MKTEKRYEKYHYHVEDGQFSWDFEKNILLGDEGDVVNVNNDNTDYSENIYILFVDGNYVECIGNTERAFPINWNEHMEL